MICRNIRKTEKIPTVDYEEIQVVIERSETARAEVLLITSKAGETGTLQNTGQREQLLYILEGKFRIEADDFAIDMESGNYVFLPEHMSYRITTVEKNPLIYLIFNSYLDEGAISDKKPIFINDVENRKVYDFGSNSTTLILDRAEAEQCEATIVSWYPHKRGAIVAHNDKEQTFFVLSGTGTVMVNNETSNVKPGDVVFVPFNTPHTTEAGDETLTYLCYNTIVTSKKYATFDEMYNIVIADRLRRWKEKDDTVGL